MTARDAFRPWESNGGQSAAFGAKQFSRLAIPVDLAEDVSAILESTGLHRIP